VRRFDSLGLAVRLGIVAVVGLVAFGLPAAALGHALGGQYESRLPLSVYLAGAGITVALSFAFVLLRDLRADPPPTDVPGTLPPAPVRIGLQAVGLVGWLWIVAQGLAGGSSSADVASLFVWVYAWVGVAIISALVFPIWQWLDPIATLHDIGAAVLRRTGFSGWDVADYPAGLGRWPAVGAFLFVVWLELVLRQGIGQTLFISIVGYTAFSLAMMAQFGRTAWRANGEVFNVWFRLLNRLAPFGLADESGHVRRRPFGSGLLEPGWTRADIVLIALGTGAILFDGLSQTTPWFDVFGAPAAPVVTLQLLGFLGVVTGSALLVSRYVGVASTGAGLLPISVGYLIAHYFTYLLIDGQRIVVALSDPLQRGDNLFGTAFYEPSGSFLPPGLVWTIQLVAVVGGHMLGAWGGHVAATRDLDDETRESRSVRMRQVPLAIVMVALTTITLWSLGQAVVVSPPATTSLAALS
jgi:hypothetical protein